MNETKLINFEITNPKPIKSVLTTKQSSPCNKTLIDDEFEIEDDNKISESSSYEKSIDRIASSTSGIIDNTSMANSPQQMLNTSLSHEKLEISTNRKVLNNCIKALSNAEEKSPVITSKSLNENIKGKVMGKEIFNNSNSSKLLTIDVMNNTAIVDTTDTNTISNEVMSLSSEEENLISNASSEISETTLNPMQVSSSITSNNYDIRGFRLSTSVLEIARSVSPSPVSPVSPVTTVSPSSPVSPTSIINTSNNGQMFGRRSYSALALIEDSNNGSPLRNSISMYSNYSFSYVNSVLDDVDSESSLAKKKKSVRFSNIVDVIDSNQKNTLANLDNIDSDLKNENDTAFPECTTVINIEDAETVDEDMKTMTSSDAENKSVVMRVEKFFTVILKYFLFTLGSIFCIFKFKKDKEERKNRTNKGQYAIINDSNSSSNLKTGIETMGDEDTLSQSSTVGDANAQDTISPSSLNCLKELNATNVISNPNRKKDTNSTIKPLNQISVVKNNDDIELYPLNSTEEYDNSNDQLIVESEVVNRMHLPLISSKSSSSFNSVSTTASMSSTLASVSYPLTINNLSKQKENLKTDPKLNNKNVISSSLLNKENVENEKDEVKSFDKMNTVREPPPLLKSSRKFSHRRQNSVRLEISY
ncbi:hypothetical protein PIROE2DRAFT_57567 [Piromyces sp. E2]|nr:hypothetical protein PIROE2DRAFT_57567 [Piromyces sp. E2]|eukprot:OUM69197.1 hypothetical protein PIROE2DRAFT_57567 [Piromyces sp. E2]